jgi:hypothetical protein
MVEYVLWRNVKIASIKIKEDKRHEREAENGSDGKHGF